MVNHQSICLHRKSGLAVTLTIAILISKSNLFIFVPNCTKVVKLVKFPHIICYLANNRHRRA